MNSEFAKLTDSVEQILFTLHWGDLGMARTISTEWYLGGMVTPQYNGNPLFKSDWKSVTKEMRSALELPANFTGTVNLHINRGAVVRTDKKPA